MTMKRLHILTQPRSTLIALALVSVLLPSAALAQTGKTQVKPGEPVTLNFVNAEIEAVARTVATLSGANVVVDVAREKLSDPAPGCKLQQVATTR